MKYESPGKDRFFCSEFHKITGHQCFFLRNTAKDRKEGGVQIDYQVFDSCRLCAQINKSQESRALCEEKRAVVIRQLIRNQRALYSPCHAGCVEVAAPLFIADKLYGVFVCVMPPIEGKGETIESQRTLYKLKYGVTDDVLDYYTDEQHLVNRYLIEPSTHLMDGMLATIFNYKVSKNFEIMRYDQETTDIDPFMDRMPDEAFSEYLDQITEESNKVLPDMLRNETGLAVIKNHIYHLYTMLINGEILRAEELAGQIISLDRNASYDEVMLNATLFVAMSGADFIKYSNKYELVLERARDAVFRIKKSETVNDIYTMLKYYIQNLADILIIKTHERHMVINRIVEYINQHYYEEIKLNDISRTMNISVAYASRLFKQQMGVSFRDYLLEVRMYYAYRYLCLSATEKSIKEVAELCGYQNIRSFYATFKKYYGCTCQHLRKMFKNNYQSLLLPPTLPVPVRDSRPDFN